MKYSLYVHLYTTVDRVPYEYHRDSPSGYAILYKDAVPLVLCRYESNSLSDIKQQAELIEKYGEVQSIEVTVHMTKIDTFILEIPDVYNEVVNKLKRLGCNMQVSAINDNIKFQLSSSRNLDTIVQKALFIVNAEIMKKEQLITRRGMIIAFDELIEPEWYTLAINKIRSIIIIEKLKRPNNFGVSITRLGDVIIIHKDSNRIAVYLSKVTNKPVVQVGSTLLVKADYSDVQNNIKTSKEECTSEITYILTQRKHEINPLLYLKCYRDLMNIDKQIDSLL